MSKTELAVIRKQLNDLMARVDSFEEFIECPMEFEKVGEYKLGLKFGNEQTLYLGYSAFQIGCWDKNLKVKTKIRKEPTPHDELEVGKWYFIHNYIDEHNIALQELYYLYLGSGDFVHYSPVNKCISLVENQQYNNKKFKYHEVVVDE